jgi:hypothetical protein
MSQFNYHNQVLIYVRNLIWWGEKQTSRFQEVLLTDSEFGRSFPHLGAFTYKLGVVSQSWSQRLPKEVNKKAEPNSRNNLLTLTHRKPARYSEDFPET